MKIIETYLQSKSGDISSSEDAIYFDDNFACVIDGATSTSELLWDGSRAGKFASELIHQTLASLGKETRKEETIKKINDRLANEYRKRNFFDRVLKNPNDRLIASVVIFSRFHSEVWIVGDCKCLLNGTVFSNKNPYSEFLSEIRALYIQTEILSGKSIQELQELDTGREYILPLVKRQGLFQNSVSEKMSFGVIDGFELERSFIKTINVPSSAEFLTLSSDGYPSLMPTLDESERVLKEILEEDPLCINKYRSTKGKSLNGSSFDDRAYLRIML